MSILLLLLYLLLPVLVIAALVAVVVVLTRLAARAARKDAPEVSVDGVEVQGQATPIAGQPTGTQPVVVHVPPQQQEQPRPDDPADPHPHQ